MKKQILWIPSLLFFSFFMLFSCSKNELKDCYKTVCYGEDNTDCVEEPQYDSGCFPMG